MQRMWRETAVPYLQRQGWGKQVIYSRILRFWGIGESSLAQKVAPFFDLTNPTVAPYASKGQVRLRITAKADSPAAAEALIAPVEQQIRDLAGLDYFGSDEDTLALVVGALLRNCRATLSVAESCTAGGLGAMVASVAGSSDYFVGGMIAYENRIKQSLLGVEAHALAQFGAVSSSVAEQMALGVKRQLATDWGLSITGIAGPDGGTDTKPVGLVYIGLAQPEGEVESFEYRLGAGRERPLIQHLSACHALDRLRRKLLQR